MKAHILLHSRSFHLVILSYDSSNSGCKYINTMNTMITLYPPTLSPNINNIFYFGDAKIFF